MGSQSRYALLAAWPDVPRSKDRRLSGEVSDVLA